MRHTFITHNTIDASKVFAIQQAASTRTVGHALCIVQYRCLVWRFVRPCYVNLTNDRGENKNLVQFEKSVESRNYTRQALL